MQAMDLSNLGQSSAGPDLSKTTAMECICGGQFFSPGLHFRKSSALASSTGKVEITPVEVYLCIDCGDVFQDLLPKELRPDDGQN
jgi:hypothetical protein